MARRQNDVGEDAGWVRGPVDEYGPGDTWERAVDGGKLVLVITRVVGADHREGLTSSMVFVPSGNRPQ